ncbi:hypothetical protein SEA_SERENDIPITOUS_89 [Mycobacterium phage Serendipitous]|uniref:Uncharacterized protein n=1 Tax=Mycobacterium phage Serendipitous TaxID=2301619 RepID=A0A385UI21_9CAUD|nr:hypothetical protein I5G64_gp89 [Mycobacterium phage Serendipitous]AYB70630.1 hypothetical protein SEA_SERENDIPITOUS_89 [Mycobacterium phage Serendipitous]
MSNDNEGEKATDIKAAPVTAAQLRAEAARARAIAEELTRQAAEQAVAEEEARKPKMPNVNDGPVFVAFSRYMSGREYAFAAVGWRTGRSVRWAVTGAEERRFNWPGLLQFVGEANWPTLRVMVDGDSLLPEGYEPPVAEEMGAFGQVLGTSDPARQPVDRPGIVGILTGVSPRQFAEGGYVSGQVGSGGRGRWGSPFDRD